MKKFFVSTLLAVCCTAHLHAADTNEATAPQQSTPADSTNQSEQSNEAAYKDASITLLLPVNHMMPENNRINLAVHVSQDFKPVFSMEQSLKTGFYKFRLQSESDSHNNAETIIAGIEVGKRISAVYVNDFLKKGVIKQTTDASVIHEDNNSYGAYTFSKLTMTYTRANRRELLTSYAYSGPYDCAYVQYSVILSGDNTQEKALAKQNFFAHNNLSIIRF